MAESTGPNGQKRESAPQIEKAKVTLVPTSEELKMLQALPLDLKVARTKQRIREWVDYWGKDRVSVFFSGGKDSTVLLHIVREMYGNDIPAVFVNTGLEFPEIQRHVRTFDNVVTLVPEMNFREVITRYGYPVISKDISQAIDSTKKWYSKNVHVERERERERDGSRRRLPNDVEKLLGVGAYSGAGRESGSGSTASCGGGTVCSENDGEHP